MLEQAELPGTLILEPSKEDAYILTLSEKYLGQLFTESEQAQLVADCPVELRQEPEVRAKL